MIDSQPTPPGPPACPHPSGGVWLEVPFDEKDHAKALGARWDPQARMWWAPPPNVHAFAPWWALPALLPWEDRSFGGGLFVDLIPQSCWFTNVRSCVSERDWFRIRKMVYGRAGDRCEACGAGPDHGAGVFLEAHERWLYDDASRTQVLRRLICLCTRCHQATHFGYAEVSGNRAAALAHLCAVTGSSVEHAEQHISDAFAWWRHRSTYGWTLNLRMLTDAGIAVTEPADAEHRRAEAQWRTAVERGQVGGFDHDDHTPGGVTIRPLHWN